MTGAELRVESLVAAYGGQVVLDGVSVTAPAGRTTAILGPSGGGKSTLLRCVAGLERPVSGSVLVGGTDVTGVAAHRRGIGYALQDPTLFAHLDVGGNVAFGLRAGGRRTRQDQASVVARVDEVLDLVGLGGFARRRVDRLSGGEAQRVALARALAPAPALLLADEPLAALDRVLHDRLVDDLRDLFARLSTTVVLVTHDQAEAVALADHLVVLGSGQVRQAGAPDEVWRRPASVEVASFLGHDVVVPGAAGGGEVVCAGGLVVAGDAAWVRRVTEVADGSGRVGLVVRPEAVQLSAADAAVDGPGAVGGVVRDVTFHGDHTSVTVEVGGVGALRAATTHGRWSPGDAVTVAVDAAGTWPVAINDPGKL